MSDPRLSAWLDGELAPGEALDPALKAQAEGLRRVDALLRDWYAGVPVAASRRHRVLPWGLLAAACLAMAVVLSPVLTGRRAESFAEEILDRTAAAIETAEGLLSRFTMTREEGEETQSASGEIRYGPLRQIPVFRCETTWPAAGGQSERRLAWGQTRDLFWTSERQGGRSGSTFSSRFVEEEDLRDASALYESLREGSPVGVESRHAVEGLVALLKSFRRDHFRTWMGCAWTFEGGKGTAEDPWRYRTEPFPDAPGDRIVWTLGLAAGPDGLIRGLGMEEEILDRGTRTRRSRLRIQHTLSLRQEDWPEGSLEPPEGIRQGEEP